MPINKQEELSINDLLDTFESDVICELGIEPDGDNLSVKTTDEVVEALQPVVEELLIKAKQSGIEEERKRIVEELESDISFLEKAVRDSIQNGGVNSVGYGYDLGYLDRNNQVINKLKALKE